jgi:hypothetical protein
MARMTRQNCVKVLKGEEVFMFCASHELFQLVGLKVSSQVENGAGRRGHRDSFEAYHLIRRQEVRPVNSDAATSPPPIPFRDEDVHILVGVFGPHHAAQSRRTGVAEDCSIAGCKQGAGLASARHEQRPYQVNAVMKAAQFTRTDAMCDEMARDPFAHELRARHTSVLPGREAADEEAGLVGCHSSMGSGTRRTMVREVGHIHGR